MPSLEQKSMPSDEQIRELWEWCGIKHRPDLSFGEHHGRWHDVYEYPDRTPTDVLPILDLNNLFKHAVPKLQGEYWITFQKLYKYSDIWNVAIHFLEDKNDDGFSADNKNPALALFWVIREAIKK